MPVVRNIEPGVRKKTIGIVYLITCRNRKHGLNGLIRIGNTRKRSAFHRWGRGFSNIMCEGEANQTDWYKFKPKHSTCTLDIYWYKVDEGPDEIAYELDKIFDPNQKRKLRGEEQKRRHVLPRHKKKAEEISKEYKRELASFHG
jgi:hypothetical protein